MATTKSPSKNPAKTAPTLDLWRALAVTDPKYTKEFDRGSYGGTTINKQYCWLKLSQQFGPNGIGWGTEEEKVTFKTLPNDDVLAMVRVQGWYMLEGEKHVTTPGFGSDFIFRKGKVDDDGMKKAFSDALTNAFKYIGLSADVYLGLYDDDKYREYLLTGVIHDNISEDRAEESSEELPDEDERSNRDIALDMMEMGTDPGEGFFTCSRNGTVQFVAQESVDRLHDVCDAMVTLMRNMPTIESLIDVAAANADINSEAKERLERDPLHVGAYDWAMNRLKSISKPDKEKIDKSWSAITRLVNPLKRTQPAVYDGITSAFNRFEDDLEQRSNQKEDTE